MHEVFRSVLIAACLFSFASLAKNKTSCTQEQLRQKNCLLRMGPAHYQFLKQHLSIDDGVWKGVVSVPLENEKSVWQSVRLFEKSGRRFYELKVWTPPEGGVQLQSLHWVVVELKGIEAVTHLDQVIQKRRPVTGGKSKFLKDKLEKHKLSSRGKKVVWTVGHMKGEF